MKNNINLLKANETTKVSKLTRTQRILRIIAVSLLFVVSSASMIILVLIILSPLPALREEEQNARLTLENAHADLAKLIVVKERADSINNIILNRKYYGQSLEKIFSKTAGVSVGSMDIKSKTISMTLSSSSLLLLDNFLIDMVETVEQKDGFTKMNVVSITTAEGSAEYEMEIILEML